MFWEFQIWGGVSVILKNNSSMFFEELWRISLSLDWWCGPDYSNQSISRCAVSLKGYGPVRVLTNQLLNSLNGNTYWTKYRNHSWYNMKYWRNWWHKYPSNLIWSNVFILMLCLLQQRPHSHLIWLKLRSIFLLESGFDNDYLFNFDWKQEGDNSVILFHGCF